MNPAGLLTSLIDWVETRHLSIVMAIAALLGLGVVAADLATGSEISFSVFLVVPVSIVSWRAGRTAAVIASLLAAAAWYTAELIGDRVYSQPVIPMWNGLAWFGLFTLIGVLLVHLRNLIRNEAAGARVDDVTGVLNRRAFMERATVELARAARSQEPITMAGFDIDHFKRLNDSAGHAAGDEVLRNVGSIANEVLRRVDVVGRLGGDEFALLMPGTPNDKAPVIIERIHRRLTQATSAAGVTYSFGVVCFDPPPSEIGVALERVDAVMDVIKASGGDGVRYEHTSTATDSQTRVARSGA